MATKKKTDVIEIRPINIQRIKLRIVGDSPLVTHAWSDKAKRMMLEAQTGTAKGKKKEYKNPVEDFINSMYWLTPKPEEMTEDAFERAIENGAKFGVRVKALKAAAISAAYRSGWTKDKVSLRGEFFFESDENGLVEIHSDPPIMREDMVKVGMGTADLRYRGQFNNWYIDLVMRYDANSQYSLENIINMINAGGIKVGIFEGRPEKGDEGWGMFHVAID